MQDKHLALQIEALRIEVSEIKQMVKELHAVQTGAYFKALEKKLTKKEKEELEIEKMRQRAHRKFLAKYVNKSP